MAGNGHWCHFEQDQYPAHHLKTSDRHGGGDKSFGERPYDQIGWVVLGGATPPGQTFVVNI